MSDSSPGAASWKDFLADVVTLPVRLLAHDSVC